MDALYNEVLNESEREQWAARPPKSLFLKAGQVAFHHALSVHGSWGNPELYWRTHKCELPLPLHGVAL